MITAKKTLALFLLLFSINCFSFSDECISERVLLQLTIGKKGDTICYRGVFRDFLNVKTTPLVHCGIDLGDGFVAEWSGNSGAGAGSPKLRLRSKTNFIQSAPDGERIFVKKYDQQTNDPDDIVLFARHYVANPYDLGSYSIFLNNCQHFCALCSYGRRESWQAKPIVDLVHNIVSLLTLF